MVIALQVIAIAFLVIYFLAKAGWKKWGKLLMCVMMVIYLGPLGIIFSYFFWNMDKQKM